jgi:hypothetical protein
MTGEICRPAILVLPKPTADEITGITTNGEPSHFYYKTADDTTNFRLVAAAEAVVTSS